MEFFAELTWVHWFALGFILLALEALGASGFLIGAAVAALAQAVLVAVVPELSFVTQLVIYAAAAVVATVLYLQVFRDMQRHDNAPVLNERAHRHLGRHFTLEEALDGEGRVQLGDTFWKVRSLDKIERGTEVEVVRAEGQTLTVEPRNAS